MSASTNRARSVALTGLLAIFAAAANAQNTPSPAPGRDLQALSCPGTIPTATPKDPRQPLINCAGDYFTPFDGELMNFTLNKLERVTVTGRSTSAWKTLCIGLQCAELLGDEAVATRVNEKMGFWGDLMMSILRKQPLKMSACSNAVNVEYDGRAITSKGDVYERTHAAGIIVKAYMKGGNFINTQKTMVFITFSDDGTQTFEYNTANPAAPIPQNDLKEGDGKSRCA